MDPFCNVCSEDFPLDKEPTSWRMGFLRSLSKATLRIRRRFKREDDNNYLCGNCYFDLTD